MRKIKQKSTRKPARQAKQPKTTQKHVSKHAPNTPLDPLQQRLAESRRQDNLIMGGFGATALGLVLSVGLLMNSDGLMSGISTTAGEFLNNTAYASEQTEQEKELMRDRAMRDAELRQKELDSASQKLDLTIRVDDDGNVIIEGFDGRVDAPSPDSPDITNQTANTLPTRLTGIEIEREDFLSFLASISNTGYDTLARTFNLYATHPDKAKTRMDLMQAVDGMTMDEYQAFLDTFEYVDPSQQGQVVVPADLENIYKELEQKYPNKVNASQRLKAINEMNAVDYKYYVIEPGDTLGKISQAFGVPIGQIVELNGIQDANVIYYGDVLVLPTDTPQQSLTRAYK